MADWEPIAQYEGDSTERLRIEGGWLYRTSLWRVTGDPALAVALVFVSDPNGEQP
jgi:hypothetical protein